jgi:hypothetical protein
VEMPRLISGMFPIGSSWGVKPPRLSAAADDPLSENLLFAPESS